MHRITVQLEVVIGLYNQVQKPQTELKTRVKPTSPPRTGAAPAKERLHGVAGQQIDQSGESHPHLRVRLGVRLGQHHAPLSEAETLGG
ncbi:MAG: hypothetical protein JWN85_3502 [Gammaproteobacteria bacterium]|nr:hypothetical protein [Gammaproteobacteria bacterium]